jgi:hypothetical protein
VSKEGYNLDAQKGSFYDTQLKQFKFFEGLVETEESRVKADELFYDEPKAYYEGKKDVRVLNKERELEVFGDVGNYWETKKYSQMYGKALVRKYFESDTPLGTRLFICIRIRFYGIDPAKLQQTAWSFSSRMKPWIGYT